MSNNQHNQKLALIRFIRSLYNTDSFIPLHEPKFIGDEKKKFD